MHRIFSNFAYILLLGMSGMGLLMGKIKFFKKKKVSFIVNGPIPNYFYFKAYSK